MVDKNICGLLYYIVSNDRHALFVIKLYLQFDNTYENI